MVKYNNIRSTKMIKPDIKPAPAIKPLFNIGALLDIPTGMWVHGKHGESILLGGLV